MFKKKNISEELKSQAIGLGLCEQWTNAWGKPNMQELINKFLHGIDFCIKHDWPSNEYIKKQVDKELLHKNNIYIDEDVQRRNARQIVVIQGECTGTLLYDGLTTADIYVRHNSDITIDCSRMSKVFISVYDNAKIRVIQKDMASVYIYKHSKDCLIDTEGEVMQREFKPKND